MSSDRLAPGGSLALLMMACQTGFTADSKQYACDIDLSCGPSFVCRAGRCVSEGFDPGDAAVADGGPTDAGSEPGSDAGACGALCLGPNPCWVARINCAGGTPVCRELDPPIPAPEGTPCDDSITCTDPDTCRAGQCSGIPRPPPGPSLIAPLSTAYATGGRPQLRWGSVASASGYFVEVCSQPECPMSERYDAGVGTSIVASRTLPAGVYFWRVVAANACGTSASPLWELIVGPGFAPLSPGAILSGAPDFNRDGRPDLAIGSVSNRTQIYINGSSGLPPSPTTSVDGGRRMAYAGDVNGDGYGDLIVGETPNALVYLGQSDAGLSLNVILPPPLGLAGFGASVAGAGDVNGDGFADVLVGGDNPRMAGVYLGGPAGITTRSAFITGTPVAGANDINGDGYADVIAGAPVGQGLVYVYHGGPTGLTLAATLPRPMAENLGGFGEGVASAGDVNGDGFADVLVAAGGTARAWLFYGSMRGLQSGTSYRGAGAGGPGFAVSTSLAHAGDVNADGFSDVIVGGYNASLVRVFMGSSSGLTDAGVTISLGGGEYGHAVASLGDADGDGFADIIIGPGQCSGYSVRSYRGSDSGPVMVPPMALYLAPSFEDCFGISFAR